MRTLELWNDTISPPEDTGKNISNVVWCLTFNTDGSQLLAVVGDAILVYDTATGEMAAKPIRGGHKENILCIAYSKDGKRFATGGADKTVVVWKNTFIPELKYTHSDSIQCIAFNPLSSQVFSGGVNDFALWTPDLQNIEKNKYNYKILCCAWTHDGQYIAFGSIGGTISIRDKKLNEKIEIKRKAPIWCLEWSPLSSENPESLLTVGSWDQAISFWDINGKQIGSDKTIGFDPLSINYFANGDFFVLSGTNKKASLWTREGGFIANICEKKDWIWSLRIKPKQMVIATSTNDGNISMHQITSLIVHGLYQDRYAYRDVITDIVVQNMLNENKIRIKCKELVKKISIFKDRLAVQLNEKILIYLANSEESQELKYKLYKKINKKVECSLLVVTSNSIILCQEKKLQMLNFSGDLEREWVLESLIRYIKVVGGPSKRENLLVGLKNGHVLKIFIDNSFPVVLIKQNVPIRCIDISPNKLKLAVVDDNSVLSVYDLVTKELLFSEMNVTSVAWNTDLDDLLAYSGNGMLFIKTGSFPPTSQKMNGFVVGFKGSKLFVLHFLNMTTLDVPQTTSLLKYIEKKDFKTAYKLACLGITEQDFKLLGTEALQGGDLDIARKCFHRIKDVAFIELVIKSERESKNGTLNELQLQADVLAYQQKYHESANLLIKGGAPEKAVELFTELKDWDNAKLYASKGGMSNYSAGGQGGASAKIARRPSGINNSANSEESKIHMDKLMKEQAQWAMENGDWKAGSDLFINCKEYRKAVEILGPRGQMDSLVQVLRMLDKNEHLEVIQQCAFYFRKNSNHAFAKEAYLKLGDLRSLMALHVEMGKWDEAFMLAKQNPDFIEMIRLPYAEWLCKNDKYEDALKVYKSLGRPDLSSKILNQLSENATVESRFRDASYFFWVLATENLSCIQNAAKPSIMDQKYYKKFQEYSDTADIYYAYSLIYYFLEEPFQSSSGLPYYLSIFNACRFIISKLKDKPPVGVSSAFIYFAMSKVSRLLEGFKTTRICFDKLSNMKIPSIWDEEVELSSLLIKSKPVSDKETLQPICNRCMNPNQILSNEDTCSSCFHKFVHSFVHFECLPVVEFKVAPKLTHKKVLDLINCDKSDIKQKTKKKLMEDDGWSETIYGNQETLAFKQGDMQMESTPFLDKMTEVCDMQSTHNEYIDIVLDENLLKTLQPDEVYWVDYTKYCPTMGIKYYKNMVPEIPLIVCEDCGRFFLLDDYEFEFLKTKKCIFCKAIDKKSASNKDIFEL